MTNPTPGPSTTAAESKPPVITRSEVTWRGEKLFDAGPTGRQHRIDAGAKEAPGPVEALLGAIASCSSVDVLDILAKRKTPVERLSVQLAGERRGDYPRRLMKLDIEFRIDGAAIERDQAERAIQLSFERYCSVACSLAGDIVVNASLTLNGETYPARPLQIWTPGA
ncbi:MAG TPA: OsmC family protein [Gemmatimonadaceae bacterium]|jgi:putative redox protein|nr:OsmC family protein [Gemmatimonadaceae bacterium]